MYIAFSISLPVLQHGDALWNSYDVYLINTLEKGSKVQIEVTLRELDKETGFWIQIDEETINFCALSIVFFLRNIISLQKGQREKQW